MLSASIAAAVRVAAVWIWVRDRRFSGLAEWFNGEVRSGRVLVRDLVVLELVRLSANAERAQALATSFAAFDAGAMPGTLWSRAREVQLALAGGGDRRRVPAADLLIAATAEAADVPLVRDDRDYERAATVTGHLHAWFVPDS